MTDAESGNRMWWSRVGTTVLVIGVGTAGAGLISSILVGSVGTRIAVAGVLYAVAGVAFRPATWDRISYPFYPQRTPMAGILIAAATTGSLTYELQSISPVLAVILRYLLVLAIVLFVLGDLLGLYQ